MLLTSFEELMEWVNKNEGDYYYRCYAKESELTATLGRKNRELQHPYLDHEFDMVKEFALQIVNQLGDMPFLKLLELGQHFGLPTRFIDFTVDPYVALFFGLGTSNQKQFYICKTDETNPNISVGLEAYGITLNDINSLSIADIVDNRIDQLSYLRNDTPLDCCYLNSRVFEIAYNQFFSTQQNYTLIPFDPYETRNPRIMAQKGLFVAMKEPTKPLQKELFEEIKVEFNDFDVKRLRELLDKKGYTADKLFVKKVDIVNVDDLVTNIRMHYSA